MADYVGRLGPEDALDARGASIDEQHCRTLAELLVGAPVSSADFSQATFTDDANFHEARLSLTISFRAAQFAGGADFGGAQFTGYETNFAGAEFGGYADFSGARFNGIDAGFLGTRFASTVDFSGTQFSGRTDFRDAQFTGDARFREVQFTGSPEFDGAQFGGDADFREVQFHGSAGFAGVQFTGDSADFGEAQFKGLTADFSQARFGPAAFFGRAQFAGIANFRDVHFSGYASFGHAQFGGDAVFSGAYVDRNTDFRSTQFAAAADFSGTQFSMNAYDYRDDADFQGAHFGGHVDFGRAQFSRDANLSEAQFDRAADFIETQFDATANFHTAEFRDDANFAGTQFSATADFGVAQFGGTASFGEARFGRTGDFVGAQFRRLCRLGPLRADTVNLTTVVFEGPAVVYAACATIMAVGVRARDSLTLTGRGGDIVLTDAQFDKPARVGSSPEYVHFPSPIAEADQPDRSGAAEPDDTPPRLIDVEGTDLSNVTLVGLDLSPCHFIGAYNLDKLHIDGPPNFAETPLRSRRWWRWTRRRTLAEEHEWRATYDRRPDGWYPPRCRPRDDNTVPARDRRRSKSAAAGAHAARVQASYRELRKSFEDARNEPGAADFYYGEMEMRRMTSHAAPPHRFENALLAAYWAVSGYGLRATRALLALLLTLVAATVLFATVGFGRSEQTVYVPIRATVADQPAAYRQTSVADGKPGLRQAAYYSVQSATSLLREPISAPLTTVGRITEILVRLLGPLLLGLAVLALRGRVKR